MWQKKPNLLMFFHKLFSIYDTVRKRPMLGNSDWQKRLGVKI